MRIVNILIFMCFLVGCDKKIKPPKSQISEAYLEFDFGDYTSRGKLILGTKTEISFEKSRKGYNQLALIPIRKGGEGWQYEIILGDIEKPLHIEKVVFNKRELVVNTEFFSLKYKPCLVD